MSEKPKILILFYSMYGHIHRLVQEAKKAVEETGGIAIVKVVEELLPEKYWDENVKKLKQQIKDMPIADPRADLKGIDGLIVATPTRYGNMCAQMRQFWDQTGPEWQAGTLIGKPASVITSTATQHGGQETTIITVAITLIHHGMIFVGLPYSNPEISVVDEVSGGSPYGASAVVGPKGDRIPTENELQGVYKLAKRLTEIAEKLM